MRLSVAILAFNSVEYIEPLFHAVKLFADEVVVGVDASSSDTTEEICARYADKLFRLEPIGTSERAIAWLNEQCTGDWMTMSCRAQGSYASCHWATENIRNMRCRGGGSSAMPGGRNGHPDGDLASRRVSPITRSAAPSNAPASEVIRPPSNEATTARPSTRANSNKLGLHSVGAGNIPSSVSPLLQKNFRRFRDPVHLSSVRNAG